MWALDNRTPYAAERNWARDKNGIHQWIVAVKATFNLSAKGIVKLADEQVPPVLAPEYFGEPGLSSLRHDSDLSAVKPGTDVVLLGSAHARRGVPAPTVPVSLRVGELEKNLLVHGKRFYRKRLLGLTITEPEPFVSQPITYELAFGGADASGTDAARHRIDGRNPVGRGFATALSSLHGKPAHAIEYPQADPKKAGPAGYGPIDRAWSPRLEFAGTYDARWERAKKPFLPDDYDERFEMCAPLDQRPSAPMRGGERVELVNLTKEGTLRFDLPKIYLTFTTRIRGREQEHRSILASVILEPELMRLGMVWQAHLSVRQRDVDFLDETTIDEKAYLA